MQGANILIAANGIWPSQDIWRPLAERSDLIIACDGGLTKLLQNNIIPNLLIGDLDSIDAKMTIEEIEEMSIRVIAMPEQNSNDLSKALAYCNELNAKNIDVIGIEGGRLDHQLAAYFSLSEQDSNAILQMQDWQARLVPKTGLTLNSIELGKNISLFAIGCVNGVEMSGVKWPLNNQQLKTGTRGLHNVSTDSEISISHDSGDLLLLVQR